MRRRNFLGWMAGAGLLTKLPAWAQGPAPGVLGPLESANLQALAAVVLPASLGGARRTALVAQLPRGRGSGVRLRAPADAAERAQPGAPVSGAVAGAGDGLCRARGGGAAGAGGGGAGGGRGKDDS